MVGRKVMRKISWVRICLLIVIVFFIVFFCYFLYFAFGPISENTIRFWTNLQPKHEQLLLCLDKWEQRSEKFPVQFSAKEIAVNLHELHSPEISRMKIEYLLLKNSAYVEKYIQTLSEEEYSEFYHQIYLPIRQDRYLYRIDSTLYLGDNSSEKIDDNIIIVKNSFNEILKSTKKHIVSFACIYDGYFDKDGFLNLINQIEESKDIDEFIEKMEQLETVTYASYKAYEEEYYYGWLGVNLDVTEALERLEAIKEIL